MDSRKVSYSLIDKYSLERISSTRLAITYMSSRKSSIDVKYPEVADSIEKLNSKLTEEHIVELQRRLPLGPSNLFYFLQLLNSENVLRTHICINENSGITIEKTKKLSTLFQLSPQRKNLDLSKHCLSRFCFVRFRDGSLILESAEYDHVLLVEGSDSLHILINLLSGSENFEDVTKNKEALELVLETLAVCKFLVSREIDHSNTGVLWEFHDLLFHRSSRLNGKSDSSGATYRFHNKLPPLSARNSKIQGRPIPLLRPEEHLIQKKSRKLWRVMERRRSNREFNKTTISKIQLSEFLYRVARVKSEFHSGYQECLIRPFPSGGAIHEIQFYIAVNNCRGLSNCIYYYDGFAHKLVELNDSQNAAQRIVIESAANMGDESKLPHLVIILSSRFPRLSWKYQSIAYRITLINLGVIVQSMYLVATDMNLACCAIGNGDVDLLNTISNQEKFEEAALGEFALGGPGNLV